MPVPKNLSALFDNIITGDAISQHNGISCYPAMDTTNDKKYILKVISVPASETQLEALYLAGALKNEEEAKSYFAQRVNELIKELDVVQQLSRQDGFIGFDDYKAVPKDASVGYDLYILTQYKRSLEKQLEKQPFTQLEAVNLGLDICSALTACRRNGYLFVNLKPSNIYIGNNADYKINDLGLVSLNALKYATIPQHYISAYTAPEITDPFASLNDTVDVYAVGMILYSIYNGNALPDMTASELPAPKYADPEMAQIILKACSADPQARWADPAQMGQMLVNYMQKNGANAIPIIPEVDETADEAAEQLCAAEVTDVEADAVAEDDGNSLAQQDDIVPVVIAGSTPLFGAEEQAAFTGNIEAEQISLDELIGMIDAMEAEPSGDGQEAYSDNEANQDTAAVLVDGQQVSAPALTDDASESTDGQAANGQEDLDAAIEQDSEDNGQAAEQTDAAPVYDGISEEVSQILSQADSLAEIVVPEPVVVPDVTALEYTQTQEDDHTDTASETVEDQDNMKNDDYFNEGYLNGEEPKKRSHWLRNSIIIAILLLLLAGAFLFYKFYVLKTVDSFSVTGSGNSLRVTVLTQTDENLLTVSCSDPSRKVVTVPVVNGTAVFTGLDASTEYTIELNISGLHILKGTTQTKYTTPAETTIVQYTVDTGDTEGTVNIKFAVNGPDSEQWSFTYHSDDQPAKTETFAGHSFTLKDLEMDKVYTGVLKPEKDLLITSSAEITFTASQLVRANDLRVISCADSTLSVRWSAPEGVTVESWFVRCYNSNYDKTQNVKNTTVSFTQLNCAEAFTVEVWAKGQTVKQTVNVAENSITVKDITADLSTPGKIALSWKADVIPQGGWTVYYTINDTETVYQTNTASNSTTISPVGPALKYTFSVAAADTSISTFCDSISCVVPDAERAFSVTVNNTEISADDLQVTMCRRPGANWSKADLTDSDYTQTFQSGANAGFLIFLEKKYEEADLSLDVIIVITDEDGGLTGISTSVLNWNSMWEQNYSTLNITSTPKDAGTYQAAIYFNNMLVNEFKFAVS